MVALRKTLLDELRKPTLHVVASPVLICIELCLALAVAPSEVATLTSLSAATASFTASSYLTQNPVPVDS